MSVAERPPGQLKRLFGKICALRIFAGPIRLLHLVLQQLPLLLGISRWRLRARGPSDDEGEHYRQSYTAETGSASHPAPLNRSSLDEDVWRPHARVAQLVVFEIG